VSRRPRSSLGSNVETFRSLTFFLPWCPSPDKTILAGVARVLSPQSNLGATARAPVLAALAPPPTTRTLRASRPLGPCDSSKVIFLTLRERPKAITLDAREVDEEVVSLFVAREAETLESLKKLTTASLSFWPPRV